MPETQYRYLGDRHTDASLKGAVCVAIRNQAGKCIRGKNGSMLVRFVEPEKTMVVIGRLLRKLP